MKTNFRKPQALALVVLAALVVPGVTGGFLTRNAHAASAAPQIVVYEAGTDRLVVEVLDDDLIHFEASFDARTGLDPQPIRTTPMIYKTNYPGAASFTNDNAGRIETGALIVQVDPETLCTSLTDKNRDPAVLLTTLCPRAETGPAKVLSISQERMRFVYGLGEQFVAPAAGSLNWIGQVRKPGTSEGNAMTSFFGGFTGNAQFPVLYALGEQGENYALFVDEFYAQTWTFVRSPWEVRMQAPDLHWYFLSGPNLPDLRQDFMELVGRAPVPPKKMFGLWISEYGYDNWAELEEKLASLRQAGFPVDGFVLDLQWFGGIVPNSEMSAMGKQTWDTLRFPEPQEKIKALQKQGIGLMTIEEPYVARGLPEFADLLQRGFLPQACDGCDGPPLLNEWWGRGSLIDWTNPAGSDYWHDTKRQPLVDTGILGHWTDLGEPEMYVPEAFYSGLPALDLHSQAEIHNYYNFAWSESIARGYARNDVEQRPFILSRSGTAGIQRFGTVLWSGDIATNPVNFSAHLAAQAHMSLSGMEYFSADTGGFYRTTAGTAVDDLYTLWFAAGSLFDVPVRPHVENLCNCRETAPDRVGEVESNLANIRLRYALSPYLYSLAHRAYRYGEAVLPPLVYYYQTDPAVMQISDQKMIGRDLMAAAVTGDTQASRSVYLPAGGWYDFYSHEYHTSQGEWLRSVPVRRDGLLRLPLYARAGAIVPLMYVDEHTLDITGLRSRGAARNELVVQVFAAPQASQFHLYEDDGTSTAYQHGQVRTTLISQQMNGSRVTVTIEGAVGTYTQAPERRDNVIRLIVPEGRATAVVMNGKALPEAASLSEFESARQGWYNLDEHTILAKSSQQDVKTTKIFTFNIEPINLQ